MDRPLCKCHGEPMYRSGFRGDSQRWACPVRKREWASSWRARNPEKVQEFRRRDVEEGRHRERSRLWRERNPEKHRESSRLWAAANPEKRRELNARRLMVGGMYLGMCGFTKTEREAILDGSSK